MLLLLNFSFGSECYCTSYFQKDVYFMSTACGRGVSLMWTEGGGSIA